MKPPKKWKMAIVIWMAIYPLITSIFFFLGKYLIQINPLPLRTLIITLIAVPIMAFVLIPFLQKVFKNWLFK
jgi:antibiotic biosynthesis monooxygenase (ABM) superfamily enzyme